MRKTTACKPPRAMPVRVVGQERRARRTRSLRPSSIKFTASNPADFYADRGGTPTGCNDGVDLFTKHETARFHDNFNGLLRRPCRHPPQRKCDPNPHGLTHRDRSRIREFWIRKIGNRRPIPLKPWLPMQCRNKRHPFGPAENGA